MWKYSDIFHALNNIRVLFKFCFENFFVLVENIRIVIIAVFTENVPTVFTGNNGTEEKDSMLKSHWPTTSTRGQKFPRKSAPRSSC